MLLCRVIGSVVSTHKNKNLAQAKLLFVKPVDVNQKFTKEREFIAIDTVDAGEGDLVLVAQEGSVVKQIMQSKFVPANAIILGVVDGLHICESETAAS
ncbi:Ethanolamine utilization protein EutN/carboxysome structural protein Ccml [Chloroherpeton thalassium ATCC 35110]|uniref:Ethanolamine utilization protein EutN/carboxysome structural protein Ccml n=1 Tax=Chloroherpeton thalassium (strain ATCC 35110 / GB-78) TaxID=517418 RepID=B3QS52_CHLT3|nr:EutN/CcmL family microcompartment protein [Chloroherpeton thalassium]ACF13997.1 Ethanolamine utilization protein EutN/carboxysome structural protein Ccml [Chloroherpeton thalassium ATCC 35110]